MTTPTRRIFPVAVTPHGRPIKNGFDAPSQPARRLRLRMPDRFHGLHHESDIDRLHREGPEDWARIAGQSVAPLVSVLRVAPTCVVGFGIRDGAGFEGHRLGGL